jgi:type I restriction enzyme S subunit
MTSADGWTECRLDEICRMRGGVAFKPSLQGQDEGEFPFIKVSDFNLPGNEAKVQSANHWVSTPDLKAIAGKTFPIGSVVFAKIGEALKHNRKRMLVRPTFIDNNLMGVVPDIAKVTPEYLFHLFRTIDIAAFDVGTAVPYVKAGTLNQHIVSIPTFDAQRRIASILGAYDDLIEVNRRRVALLEGMARGLFEEWFVRFRFPGHKAMPIVDTPEGPLPEGWNYEAVGSVIKRLPIKQRYSQKEALPFGAVPILDQGKSGVIGFHNEKPSVVASIDRPVIVFANHTCYQKLIHQSFSAIQNVLPFSPAIYSNQCMEWLHHATNGIITLNDYKGHWPEFVAKKIVVPPEAVALTFSKMVHPFHAAAYTYVQTNQRLTASRDLLLPRLISGQLSVADGMRELEDAA